MEIVYLPKFVKTYRKIPTKIKILAEKKEKLFRKNPYDPRLKTHVLRGDLEGRWSFSVNYQYRIVFRFDGTKKVHFLVIGTHEVYQ